MKEPKNEVYLAAELARVLPPVRAAKIAGRMCRMGRSWRKVAEDLCGGESVWGPHPEAGERIAKAEQENEDRLRRIQALVIGLPVKVERDPCGGLTLHCYTTEGRGRAKRVHDTALL